jgi:hypothetical protein
MDDAIADDLGTGRQIGITHQKVHSMPARHDAMNARGQCDLT